MIFNFCFYECCTDWPRYLGNKKNSWRKLSSHYARKFSVGQNHIVLTPIAWSESRSHHLSRQEIDSFNLNVFHSNGPFPLISTYYGFSDITILNQTLLAMHWDISYLLCKAHPRPTKLTSKTQKRTPVCIFIHVVSTSFILHLHNVILWFLFQSSTFHTHDSALPLLLL